MASRVTGSQYLFARCVVSTRFNAFDIVNRVLRLTCKRYPYVPSLLSHMGGGSPLPCAMDAMKLIFSASLAHHTMPSSE